MKKVWSILLTIYVTIVTTGCVVFGYLYFSSLSNKSSSQLSRAEALTLINKVYEERGLNSSKATSNLSFDYEDYQSDEFDESKLTMAYMHDASIILTKSLLESDLNENTWYQSENMGFHGFLRFYIDGQCVFLENTDKLENQQPADEDKYQHSSICRVEKTSEAAWTSAFFWQTLTTVEEQGGCCVMSYLHFKSENNKIYEFHQEEFDSTRKSVITDNVTDLSEIAHVYVYDCNLNTHKVLDRTGSKESLLTENEKLQKVNDLIDTAQQICKVRILADFGDYSTDLPENIFDAVQEYVNNKISK